MATITTILSTDAPADSRTDINDNFDAINTELVAATSAIATKAPSAAPTFTGVVTTSGAIVSAGTAMSGNTINVAIRNNLYSATSDATWTHSATPAVGQEYGILVTADGANRTITLPVTALSANRGGSINDVTFPANQTHFITIKRISGAYLITGDPVTPAQVKSALAITPSDITGTMPISKGGTGLTALGTALQVVRVNSGATALEYADPASGSGDVTAASSFGADNRIIRSDGTGKGVQGSGAEVDDSGNVNVLGDGVQGSLGLSDAHATTPKTIRLTVPATITDEYNVVLPGTIPTAGQVMRVASVAGAVVTLEHATPVVLPALSALTFASTLDLAFTDAFQRRSLAMTGNLTLTGSGYADKRKLQVFVAGDTVTRTIAVPSGWIPIGAAVTELAANKNAVLSLECTSGSESGVRCAWGVQP